MKLKVWMPVDLEIKCSPEQFKILLDEIREQWDIEAHEPLSYSDVLTFAAKKGYVTNCPDGLFIMDKEFKGLATQEELVETHELDSLVGGNLRLC
jgi:hypothetical protein